MVARRKILLRSVSLGGAVLMSLIVLITCSLSASAARGPTFLGDFENGSLAQWPICQDVADVSLPCNANKASYSMTVQSNVVRQGKFAARFEVHQGDEPGGICCGDRSELSAEQAGAANEGDDRWYQWSTRFDTNYPAQQGWSVVSQWHANQDGPPPLAIVSGPTNVSNDHWGIALSTWNSPGNPGPTFVPWNAPINRGAWNDIKMHVHWSASDNVGFIEFWLNGVRQTFSAAPCAGQTRCMVRTLMPGGGGVYFKQGYYRDPTITQPGVVYHDGLSIADAEADLQPL